MLKNSRNLFPQPLLHSSSSLSRPRPLYIETNKCSSGCILQQNLEQQEIWTIRPEKETIYNSYLNITRKYLYFVVYQLLVYSELINYNSSFKLEKIIKDYLQQHHKLLRIVWRSQLPLCWRWRHWLGRAKWVNEVGDFQGVFSTSYHFLPLGQELPK